MGSNDLSRLPHDQVKSKLSDLLSRYTEARSPQDNAMEVSTEEGIQVPYHPSNRVVDVLLEFKDSDLFSDQSWRSGLQGCAFDIKTRSEPKKRGCRQLYHYSKAGYQPILVAPGWLVIEDGDGIGSYEWMVDMLDHGCVLEIVSASPLRFTHSAPRHSQLVAPGLREFLMQSSVSD
jgi:hypothetical protein